MSVEIIERPTIEVTDQGDHERFKHVILEGWHPTKDGERTGDFIPEDNSVIDGVVNGKAIKSLCGKVWVPQLDSSRFPLCPTCEDICKRYGWKIPS